MKQSGVTAYPLQWPTGWPRTAPGRRTINRAFVWSKEKARDELIREVSRMGGSSIVISSNMPLRRDGMMSAASDINPGDGGVAVYFQRKGKSLAFACDKYIHVEDNLRALSLTIEALRGLERWGASEMMERAFSGFKQLAAENEGPNWWDVLQVPHVACPDVIEAAYRRLAKVAHPDTPTGSHEAMSALNAAREQGLAVAGGAK